MIQSPSSGIPAPQPIVVDTDIVSYAFKQDSRALLYQPHLTGRLLVLSFMTIAELDAWAEIHQWGQPRRDEMERFLAGYVVHYPDRDLCRLWAGLSAAARRVGRPIQAADAWVAASALLYAVPLVTHNPDDYAGVSGLTLLSATAP
jgi:tRNA(fMet)-specific endonuclease VapC